jgi:hypothetical protein
MTPGKLPTWDEAHAIVNKLAAERRVAVVYKDDDPASRIVAALLDLGREGIARLWRPAADFVPMTGEQYLTEWATYTPKRVALPRELAPAHPEAPRAYLELCVHEFGHDAQWEDDDAVVLPDSPADPYATPGGLAYVQLYMTGDLRDLRTLREFAAQAEADAEAGRLEVHHLLTGEVPRAEDAVKILHGPAYLLREGDRALQRTMLAQRLAQIRRRIYASPIARRVAAICEAEHPHLLAQP